MPKLIELTVELEIQRVSCPGVWLCQDGRVSLTVYALGTNYQTCSLPPMFPLMFKDVFYFRKRFQETCALNNICCLLKDETIYCELVQWCDDCMSGACTILAQYLGALNDVLFPPNLCSNEGVDLLMRRSKEFPGILSPKIEIATKVRIDEVWNQPVCGSLKPTPCMCKEAEAARQRQVCHSAQYHRTKCYSSYKRPPSTTRSRSRSSGSRSCCSLTPAQPDPNVTCRCPNPAKPRSPRRRSPKPPCKPRRCPEYSVYNVNMHDNWMNVGNSEDYTRSYHTIETDRPAMKEDTHKTTLESRFIEELDQEIEKERVRRIYKPKESPCVCQICKRYHELFHSNKN